MMTEKLKEKLEEYCRKTLAGDGHDNSQRQEWAFGAMDFACSAGLISNEEYKELLEQFDLVHW